MHHDSGRDEGWETDTSRWYIYHDRVSRSTALSGDMINYPHFFTFIQATQGVVQSRQAAFVVQYRKSSTVGHDSGTHHEVCTNQNHECGFIRYPLLNRHDEWI
jgi:hypothetical protein